MKIIPKNELIIMLVRGCPDRQYLDVNDMQQIFERFGDDIYPRSEYPDEIDVNKSRIALLEGNEMITAAERAEITENVRKSKVNEWLSEIDKAMEKAVESGERQIEIKQIPPDSVILRLEELGYKTRNNSSQREGTEFIIVW